MTAEDAGQIKFVHRTDLHIWIHSRKPLQQPVDAQVYKSELSMRNLRGFNEL
nr:hypothetical protein [uncultured bacterium]